MKVPLHPVDEGIGKSYRKNSNFKARVLNFQNATKKARPQDKYRSIGKTL